jgi:hypothetical protein
MIKGSWLIILVVLISCKGPEALPQDSRQVGIELPGDSSQFAYRVSGIDPAILSGLSPRQKAKAIKRLAKAGPRKIKVYAPDKSTIKIDNSVKDKSKSKPVTKAKTDNSQGKGAWKVWCSLFAVAGVVFLVWLYVPRFWKVKP